MKKLLVFIAISLTLFNAQCHKDCVSEKLGDLVFTQDELNIVPYNGTETLVFKDSLNDSIVFYGISRQSVIGSTYYEFSSSVCPGNYYIVHGNLTLFNGQNNSEIRIGLSITNPFLNNIEKIIGIIIKSNSIDTLYFGDSFVFNATSINNYNISGSIVLTYNDSLNIGTKTFYNVYTLKKVKNISSITDIEFLFYSLNEGIVGFKTLSGHLWCGLAPYY